MSALGSPVKSTGTAPTGKTSAAQGTSVGGGSRPGGTSKHPIDVSSPSDHHTLDRKPPSGWLK